MSAAAAGWPVNRIWLRWESMPRIQNFVKPSLLAAVFGLALLQAATAQEANEDKIVAIVNGHEIKVSEVQMAAEDIIGQLPDLAAQAALSLHRRVSGRTPSAGAGRGQGRALPKPTNTSAGLALYQAKALRDAYFFQKIRPQVTDEEIKAAYDEEAAKVAQTERVRARHILVGTEKEAKDILARLNEGREIRGSGQEIQSRRLEGLRRRSRLFHRARNGAGILQGRLRA